LTEPQSVFHEGKIFNDVKWEKMPYIINGFSKKNHMFREDIKKIP